MQLVNPISPTSPRHSTNALGCAASGTQVWTVNTAVLSSVAWRKGEACRQVVQQQDIILKDKIVFVIVFMSMFVFVFVLAVECTQCSNIKYTMQSWRKEEACTWQRGIIFKDKIVFVKVFVFEFVLVFVFVIVFSVECTVYNVQCTVYLYSVQPTVYSVQPTVYSV